MSSGGALVRSKCVDLWDGTCWPGPLGWDPWAWTPGLESVGWDSWAGTCGQGMGLLKKLIGQKSKLDQFNCIIWRE